MRQMHASSPSAPICEGVPAQRPASFLLASFTLLYPPPPLDPLPRLLFLPYLAASLSSCLAL
eukprot:646129-Pleurochrysis_carterae.AAC.1